VEVLQAVESGRYGVFPRPLSTGCRDDSSSPVQSSPHSCDFSPTGPYMGRILYTNAGPPFPFPFRSLREKRASPVRQVAYRAHAHPQWASASCRQEGQAVASEEMEPKKAYSCQVCTSHGSTEDHCAVSTSFSSSPRAMVDSSNGIAADKPCFKCLSLTQVISWRMKCGWCDGMLIVDYYSR